MSNSKMDPCSIHVGWLHDKDCSITESHLRSHFRSCGAITRVTVNNYKCFAFVEFSDPRAVDRVLEDRDLAYCPTSGTIKKKLTISPKWKTIPGYKSNRDAPVSRGGESRGRSERKNPSALEFLDSYAYKNNIKPPQYSLHHHPGSGSNACWQYKIVFKDCPINVLPSPMVGGKMDTEEAAKERAARTFISRMKDLGDADAREWISAQPGAEGPSKPSQPNVYATDRDRDPPKKGESAQDYLERIASEQKLDPPKYSPYKDKGSQNLNLSGASKPEWQYTIHFDGLMIHGVKMSTQEDAKEKAASKLLSRWMKVEGLNDPPTCPKAPAAPRQTIFPYQNKLFDYAATNKLDAPVYTLISETGPPHNKRFQYKVTFHGKAIDGAGMSRKKEGMESAAETFIKVHLKSLLGFISEEADPSHSDKGKAAKRSSSSQPREDLENLPRKRPKVPTDDAYRMRENRPSDAITSTSVDILLADRRERLPDVSAIENPVDREDELEAVLYYESRKTSSTKRTLDVDEIKANKELIESTLKEGENGNKVLTWSTEDSTFSSFRYEIMVYLQLSSGCGKPHAIIKERQKHGENNANGKFEKLLKTLAYDKMVPIIDAPEGNDLQKLYLCSVPSHKCFYGWFVEPRVLQHIKETLRNKRLTYCFDLDETLLKAFVGHKIGKEKVDPDFKDTLAGMFKEFQDYGHVTHPLTRERIKVTYEQVKMKDGTMKNRPVARLEMKPGDHDSLSIVFTRIDPEKLEQTMVFFLRPGWKSLLQFLKSNEGSDSAATSRKESSIFVSTKGEMEYSYEAWRLLDIKQELLQRSQYRNRITNVPNNGEEKSLHHSILHYGKEEAGISSNESPRSTRRKLPKVPYALAIDDRDDVWKGSDKDSVYKCSPFKPQEYNCLRSHTQIKNFCSGEYDCMRHMKNTMQELEELNQYQLEELQKAAKNAMNCDEENASPPTFYAPFFPLDVKPLGELLKEAKRRADALLEPQRGEIRRQSSQIQSQPSHINSKSNNNNNKSSSQEGEKIKERRDMIEQVRQELWNFTKGRKKSAVKDEAKVHLQAIEKLLQDQQEALSKETSASTLLQVLRSKGLLKSIECK